MIWVPSNAEAWEPGTLLESKDPNTVNVRLKSGAEVKIPGPLSKYDSLAQGALEESCENLVDLESFNEGIILHHTKKRFSEDKIYTFVGSILIALNPYKNIDIYGPQVIDRIYNLTKQNETVPPHVFSIGAAAVRNMRQDVKDQSVLISGESGAGKTEATKKILQFISTICGSTASRVGASIENQILDSNPLLESFGNAKTIRNNNSSRFGKYMEVNFDKRNNIKGCNIVAYLLEKSRVVKQGPNERNYHVFYMLLAGASKDMKRDLSLKQPDQFHYLAQSGCMEVERRSENTEYDEMQFAMNSLAFDFTSQTHIYQCLAGILHLGNLTFSASRDQEGGSKVGSPTDCRRVATLLGVSPDGLERALCCKEAQVNGETLLIHLSPEKAVDQRDTLAKYVYGKVFDYIVAKVNSSLFRGKHGSNIGVLDIFGFEVFKLNSFEQLCINYCNERLQTFFNEIIFEGEMKTYSAEGLPVDDIKFIDNVGCVRLVDLKGVGIFAMLDEEISVPKGSDQQFVSKLNATYADNPKTKSVYFGRCIKSAMEFTVHHFAGPVTYEATDFMEKNKDVLAEALVAQMQASSITMLHAKEDPEEVAAAKSGGSGRKKGSRLTLAAKFKLDLDNLMTTLRSTVPHFIRCVKPNNDQTPNKFDADLSLKQLRYSGLFEAIRIRKSGYAVRMPHDMFIKRYKHCVLTIPKEVKQQPADYCNALLTALTALVPPEVATAQKGKPKVAVDTTPQRPWVVGLTRVFLRHQLFKHKLDLLREQFSSNNAVPMQKIVRGFITRRRYFALMGDKRKAKAATRALEAEERRRMALADAASMEFDKQFRNDFALQRRLAEAKAERSRLENQKQFVRRTGAATKIQRIFRGKVGRTSGRIFMCEQMFELALSKRDETRLRRAIVLPSVLGVTSKLIKVYQFNAKNLILEVLNEAYVSNQLQEAVTIGSVEILRDAIRLAEEAHMPYLADLKEARAKLESVVFLKSTLASMHGILSKCVTVPKLLAKVDALQYLVEQATALGLAGEFQVQQAAFRMGKIRNLVALRDKMRFAVEICSPSKMKSAMLERAKLLRIYGAELCAEEAAAVEGMFRMLNYQQNVEVLTAADEESHDLLLHSSSATDDEGLSARMSTVTLSNINSADSGHSQGSEFSDVFLPPFVRKPLDDMRGVRSEQDLNSAIDCFVKLVPDEGKRKFYVRVFKWVVAFATWRYGAAHEKEEGALLAGTSTSTHNRKESDGAGHGSTQKASAGSITKPIRAFHGGSSCNVYQTPTKSAVQPHQSASSKTSAGIGGSQTLFASSRTLQGSSGTAKPASTVSDSKGKAVSSGKHSDSVGAKAARKTPETDEKTSFGATTQGTASMPFAERQSRSQVAVHELLKKGKKMTYGHLHAKTDRVLEQSIQDYDKFVAKLKPASKWSG